MKAAAFGLSLYAATAAAAEGDVEYGAYLAGECTTCHKPDVEAVGIPPIIGWHEETFVAIMLNYKDGIREHQVMNTIAARLGPEEVAALAAYFATIEN